MTILTRTRLGFASGLTLVAAAGVAVYFGTVSISKSGEKRVIIEEHLKLITHVLSTLKDAETGQRGFLLTGKKEYLSPFNEAVRNIPGEMTSLKGALLLDPDQSRIFSAYTALVESKLAELKLTISLRQKEGLKAALVIVNNGSGQRAMDRIRKLSAELEDKERVQIKTINAKSHWTFHLATVLSILASCLATLLLSIAAWISRKRSGQIARALAEAQKSKQELTVFFDVALDLLCISGTDGYFYKMNPAWELVLGYSPEELCKIPYKDLIHPDDLEPTVREVQKQMNGSRVIHFENRFRCKNGDYKLLQWNSVPIGNFMYAAAQDITDRRAAESSLKQQQNFMKDILDNLPVALFCKDATNDFRFTLWNKMSENIFGLRKEDVIGKNDYDFFPKEQSDHFLKCDRETIMGGKIQEIAEEQVDSKSLGRITLHTYKVPVANDGGPTKYLLGISENITERKKAEFDLFQKRSQLSEAQKIAHLGNWEWDLPSDQVIWSDEMYRIHGLIPGEIFPTYQVVRGFTHLEDRMNFDEKVKKCREEKIPYDIEYRVLRRDGTSRMLVGSGKAICNSEGQTVKLFGICQDITERKKTTDALKALIDFSPLSTIVTTADGKIEVWNHASERIFGWKEKEVLGRDMPFVTEDQLAESKEIFGKVLRGQRLIGHEVTRRRKDGAEIVISQSAVPLIDARGEAYGVLEVLADITKQKANELEIIRARELADRATLAKSEFLAHMSHEIRTPINGVIGMTGLLLDTELTVEQRDYADMVRLSADNLLTLINDVLDFSKIEAGKLDLEIIDFDLEHLLYDLERTLGFAAAKKGIRLVKSISPKITHLIYKSDPGKLIQILTNLTNNAIKFTSKGQVSIKVLPLETIGETIGEKVKLKFQITDTGIGIPENAMGRLFKAFSQADKTTTRKFGGTGLGLSISKQLVNMLGGEIGVESIEGKGSTFWFTLTLEKGKLIAIRKLETTKKAVLQPSEKRIRILLAEDNSINQLVAMKMLQKHGYYVDAVANGLEAIDALRTIPYDLVLMDCQMPELDGYEATRIIRKSKTLTAPLVPIIAMTANAMTGDREKCLSAGMDDYVTKPVKAQDLISAIERVLENSRKAS